MSKRKRPDFLKRSAKPVLTGAALTGGSGAMWATVFQSLGDPLISAVVVGIGLLAAAPFLAVLLESDTPNRHGG